MIFLAAAMVTDADPDFDVSCVDVAVIVAVPVATAVTLPDELTVATAPFDVDHVTVELNVPFPVTCALHCALAPTLIEAGQVTLTPVMVEDAAIVTLAEPDFVVSSVDVAVIVAVPAAAPVTLPEELTVATPVLEDVQVTPELKLPVPVTVGVHEAEDPTVIDDGHVTETAVIVGCGGGGADPPPPPPPPHALIRASSDATIKPFAARMCFRFMRLPSDDLVHSIR